MVYSAKAQDAHKEGPKFTPEQKAERITTHLKQKLSLTDEQTEKVKAIYIAQLEKKHDKTQKRKDMHIELENALSKVFSEEQFTMFRKMEAERRAQMKTRKNQQVQPSDAAPEMNGKPEEPAEQK